MMKVTTLFLMLLLSCIASLSAQQDKGLRWGARGGLVGIPHATAAHRLGTGAYLGLSLQTRPMGEISFSYSLDYRKINNLSIEKLAQQMVFSPRVVTRQTEYLTISGFQGFQGGFHASREIKSFGDGKLNISIDGYAELMTFVHARQYSTYFSQNYNTALVEEPAGSYLSRGSGNGAGTNTRSTADDVSVIWSGGLGLSYEFAAGTQLDLKVFFDLNNRFSAFAGSSDAKLTQVTLGFTYPFKSER